MTTLKKYSTFRAWFPLAWDRLCNHTNERRKMIHTMFAYCKKMSCRTDMRVLLYVYLIQTAELCLHVLHIGVRALKSRPFPHVYFTIVC